MKSRVGDAHLLSRKMTDRQLLAGIRLERKKMKKLQTQGLHHVTLVGADRQSTIDFCEGVLGMPFIF
jgi:hypothetical protein